MKASSRNWFFELQFILWYYSTFNYRAKLQSIEFIRINTISEYIWNNSPVVGIFCFPQSENASIKNQICSSLESLWVNLWLYICFEGFSKVSAFLSPTLVSLCSYMFYQFWCPTGLSRTLFLVYITIFPQQICIFVFCKYSTFSCSR